MYPGPADVAFRLIATGTMGSSGLKWSGMPNPFTKLAQTLSQRRSAQSPRPNDKSTRTQRSSRLFVVGPAATPALEDTSGFPLKNLPPELVLHIARFLPAVSVYALASTSHAFYDACSAALRRTLSIHLENIDAVREHLLSPDAQDQGATNRSWIAN
jgi:hypothetical protein